MNRYHQFDRRPFGVTNSLICSPEVVFCIYVYIHLLASLWFYCITCCIVQATGLLRGFTCVICPFACAVQKSVRVAGSRRHDRSGRSIKSDWVRAGRRLTLWSLFRQKAATTRLLAVRPDMPHLALVQLSGDFKIVFTLLNVKYTDL